MLVVPNLGYGKPVEITTVSGKGYGQVLRMLGNIKPRSEKSISYAIDAFQTPGVGGTLTIEIPPFPDRATGAKSVEVFFQTT